MSTIHLGAIADAPVVVTQAGQVSAVADAKPALMLEIKPIGGFGFSYTKIRADTGEAVWRWPHASPLSAIGDLVDVRI